MNKLIIIGNATRDAQKYDTKSGGTIVKFGVAVNRKGADGDVDYFNVTAFKELGAACEKYVIKGMKIAVVGRVSLSTFTGRDGRDYSSLEVVANEVEFLSHSNQEPNGVKELTPVDDELPF